MTAPGAGRLRVNQPVVRFVGVLYLYFIFPYFKKHAHTPNKKQKKWRLPKSTVNSHSVGGCCFIDIVGIMTFIQMKQSV